MAGHDHLSHINLPGNPVAEEQAARKKYVDDLLAAHTTSTTLHVTTVGSGDTGKEAVKEAYELLLPSKSLIQSSDLQSAQPRIISENAGGLYLASLPPDQKQKPRTFVSWADAEKAYKRGDLAIDDPVVVLSSKALPRR